MVPECSCVRCAREESYFMTSVTLHQRQHTRTHTTYSLRLWSASHTPIQNTVSRDALPPHIRSNGLTQRMSVHNYVTTQAREKGVETRRDGTGGCEHIHISPAPTTSRSEATNLVVQLIKLLLRLGHGYFRDRCLLHSPTHPPTRPHTRSPRENSQHTRAHMKNAQAAIV